jgi:hypothetical protein
MSSRNSSIGWSIFQPPIIGADVIDLTRYYTKSEVNALMLNLPYKESVRVATNGPINLGSALGAIDGYTLQVGDRVLVKDQIDPVENGIYVYTGSGFTRSTDLPTTAVGSAYGINDIAGNGTTATVTTALPLTGVLNNGDVIEINASDTFNGRYTVTITGTHTFTFPSANVATNEVGTWSLVIDPNLLDEDIAVPVELGALYGDKIFNVSNDATFPIAIGTDPLTFAELFGNPGENYYTKAETLLLIQDAIQGLIWLDSVLAATHVTENFGSYNGTDKFLNVTGGSQALYVDSVYIPDGGRVLIKAQGTGPAFISDENGLYYYDQAADELVRTNDFDQIGSEIQAGVAVAVNFGSNNGASVWKMTEPAAGEWQWLYLSDSDDTKIRGNDIEYIVDTTGTSYNLNFETNYHFAVKTTAAGSEVVMPEIDDGDLVRTGWIVNIYNADDSTQPLLVKANAADGHLATNITKLNPGESIFLSAISDTTPTNDRWMSASLNKSDSLVLSGLDLTSGADIDVLVPVDPTALYVPLKAYIEPATTSGVTVEPTIDLYANGNAAEPVFETKTLDQSQTGLTVIDMAANPFKITGVSAKLTLRKTTPATATTYTANLYVKLAKLQ